MLQDQMQEQLKRSLTRLSVRGYCRLRSGAEGGTRTPTPLRAHDPESCASANSATSARRASRSEEHTSELQSPCNLVCRLLLEKKKKHNQFSTLSCKHQMN